MRIRIQGGRPLQGSCQVPADKSILHRALLLSSVASGESRISARDPGEDNATTVRALQALGVPIEESREADGGVVWRVEGVGLKGLTSPPEPIDCANSGTTMRLLAGLLVGANVPAELRGDASLSRRPMGRVCEPLRELGGAVEGRREGERELPPLRVSSSQFKGGSHLSQLASAQVKSALLLAGVCAGKSLQVSEHGLSRDHTERMLAVMGAPIRAHSSRSGNTAELGVTTRLEAKDHEVPGDLSAAAYLMAAALLVPDSRIEIPSVGLNPTRTGLLELLEEYQADVHVSRWRVQAGEPMGTLVSSTTPQLRALRPGGHPTTASGQQIPLLIDELVLLAAIASQAEGPTLIRDAAELRVKESDRIAKTAELLAAFGVRMEPLADGFIVEGPQTLQPAELDVRADHRLALTAAVLALASPGESVLDGFESTSISFPGFVEVAQGLGAAIETEPRA